VTSSTERRVNPGVRMSLTGETGVLMDVQRDRIYSLDRIGAEIWRLFAQGHNPEAIAVNISTVHGASVSLVHGDVLRFLDRLEQSGLVLRGGSPAPAASTSTRDPAKSATHTASAPRGPALVARSVWQLLRVDLELSLRGFGHLYRSVADHPTKRVSCEERTVAAVCRAIDHACALYPRRALCLQRSAATTRLLRDYGAPAMLVVGTRKHPLRMHAWVEVEGLVVNDKRGVKEYYQ
jgi:hypothetical protein